MIPFNADLFRDDYRLLTDRATALLAALDRSDERWFADLFADARLLVERLLLRLGDGPRPELQFYHAQLLTKLKPTLLFYSETVFGYSRLLNPEAQFRRQTFVMLQEELELHQSIVDAAIPKAIDEAEAAAAIDPFAEFLKIMREIPPGPTQRQVIDAIINAGGAIDIKTLVDRIPTWVDAQPWKSLCRDLRKKYDGSGWTVKTERGRAVLCKVATGGENAT